MEGWTNIYESALGWQVELRRALLEEKYGLAAVVLNQQDSSYHFGLSRLLVPEAQAEIALQILQDEATNTNPAQ